MKAIPGQTECCTDGENYGNDQESSSEALTAGALSPSGERRPATTRSAILGIYLRTTEIAASRTILGLNVKQWVLPAFMHLPL